MTLFFSCLFFSTVFFSHRRSARIKKPILQKLTGAPKNLGLDTFLDPVSHFGAPTSHFAGIAGGERVPPALLGFYSPNCCYQVCFPILSIFYLTLLVTKISQQFGLARPNPRKLKPCSQDTYLYVSLCLIHLNPSLFFNHSRIFYRRILTDWGNWLVDQFCVDRFHLLNIISS